MVLLGLLQGTARAQEAPDPLPNAPAEPQRPWPLRTVRKACERFCRVWVLGLRLFKV